MLMPDGGEIQPHEDPWLTIRCHRRGNQRFFPRLRDVLDTHLQEGRCAAVCPCVYFPKMHAATAMLKRFLMTFDHARERTGRATGEAYVEFKTAAIAEEASRARNQQVLRHRYLECVAQPASPLCGRLNVFTCTSPQGAHCWPLLLGRAVRYKRDIPRLQRDSNKETIQFSVTWAKSYLLGRIIYRQCISLSMHV